MWTEKRQWVSRWAETKSKNQIKKENKKTHRKTCGDLAEHLYVNGWSDLQIAYYRETHWATDNALRKFGSAESQLTARLVAPEKQMDESDSDQPETMLTGGQLGVEHGHRSLVVPTRRITIHIFVIVILITWVIFHTFTTSTNCLINSLQYDKWKIRPDYRFQEQSQRFLGIVDRKSNCGTCTSKNRGMQYLTGRFYEYQLVNRKVEHRKYEW